MFKRALFSIVGALAALSIGAAGAYFTAQVQVADSVIRAGAVAVSTVPTSAPLSVNALAPGETAVRPLAIVNDGSLPSDVVVTAKKSSGITDFYNALTVRVSANDTELYNGPMSALKSAPLRLDPGARGDLRFEIGLPAESANTLASDYAKVSLYIDAEQAH
ncbi:MAG TPA: TasA family protein [Coriobacteriia bacterium]